MAISPSLRHVPAASAARGTTEAALLACGVASALLYAGMLVGVPRYWPGYSSATRTVSELSAIGAPTRTLWVSLATAWTLLYVAFGWGVWTASNGTRALRVTAVAIIVSGVVGVFWPPMHQREILADGGKTLTDTLHLVWTVENGVLTLLAMGFAAEALGGGFRLYSVVTMAVLVAAGAATGHDAPFVDRNLPTPWIGVWERINLGAWLLWVVVLSMRLLVGARNRETG